MGAKMGEQRWSQTLGSLLLVASHSFVLRVAVASCFDGGWGHALAGCRRFNQQLVDESFFRCLAWKSWRRGVLAYWAIHLRPMVSSYYPVDTLDTYTLVGFL